ncbi:hypothetical protein PRZ48_009087 [Zasmidium cellare]|uniref:Uncharacterized protein n=1 Tax=Zasmidium cellare TaxID=395010 RepID=A0ABR0EIB3_ZASCE|nr:hypothetical protein PRZ48_009087 [Zasmidium cellare]
MLYASDSCSGIGPTFRNTIIPLTGETQLSSLMEYLGDADYPETVYKTMPFNLTDLVQTPVPASIYNKDPKCATSPDGATASASFSCRQTAPYAPIIAVPEEVSNLDPAWKHCTAWYGGLYDPPQALTAASVEAKPTLPAESPTAAAAPSKTPVESPAQVTASKQQPVASPSAASEVLGPTSPQQEPEPSATNAPSPPSEQSAASNSRQPAFPSPEPSSAQPVTQEPHPRPGQSDPASSLNGEPESPSIATPHPDGTDLDGSTQAQTTPITFQSAPPSQESAATPSEQEVNNSPKVTSPGQEPSVGPGEASMGGMTETLAAATLQDPRPMEHSASVVVAGSASYTVMQESGHVLVAQGGSTATAASGSAINLNDQSIVLGSSGEVVVGSVTAAAVETASPDASNDEVAVTGDDGHSITLKQQGSSYMLTAGSSTYALAAGSQTVIDGQTISAPNSGLALVVDGQTIASSAEPASQDNVVFDGHTLSPSFVTNHPGVQVIDGNTLTSGGGAKTIDGITASIGSNGLVLDADGSTTAITPHSAMTSRPDKTRSLPTEASPTSAPGKSTSPSVSSNEGGHAGGQVPWVMWGLISLGIYVIA